MNPWLRRTAPIIALSLLVLPALAKKKEDPLARMKPVPADQVIPVSDFFRPHLFRNPKLNPAGTHFAAIMLSERNREDLIAFEIETKKIEWMSAEENRDIYWYHWLDDRRILFQISEDKLYSLGLFAAELGRFSAAYPLQRYSVAIPIGFPRKDRLQAIVWIPQRPREKGGFGGLFKIDTRPYHGESWKDSALLVMDDDGWRAAILESYNLPEGGVVVSYLADREGELAFAITSGDGFSTLHTYAGGKWQKSPVDLDSVSIIAAGDQPGEVLALAPKEPGKPRPLQRLNAFTGEWGELLVHDKSYDVDANHVFRSPADGRIVGIWYDRKGPQSLWFDEIYQRVQDAAEKTFAGKIVRILGSDRGEQQFFISVSSDIDPVVYYHIKRGTKSMTLIADVAPWIDESRMRPMQVINYRSRDGREMEGYLTLPQGVTKEAPVPLIVLPHGGPFERDTWGWDKEVQFLASRGYAVFQPNYRGSTGYTWRFTDDEIWDFRKMHDDVTDGVKAVLKTGLIDRERLAIMGGSFGGYLALSGTVHEPDLYRCAITIAGVFDWKRMMADLKDLYGRNQYGTLLRRLGNPKQQEEKFDKISPIKHISKLKVPVFVAHGTEDNISDLMQSKTLIAELKKHGVLYEKQIERGEGHGFRKLDNQVELYTAIEAFLAKNLAPRKMAEVAQEPSAVVAEVPATRAAR